MYQSIEGLTFNMALHQVILFQDSENHDRESMDEESMDEAIQIAAERTVRNKKPCELAHGFFIE